MSYGLGGVVRDANFYFDADTPGSKNGYNQKENN
jgi:hypothetical protein